MVIAQKPESENKRIRGPNLAVLVKSANGVPMEEALVRADEANRVIASNKRLAKALVGSDEWRDIREVFACWTGTMTAYNKPDQKLGKIIGYTDSDTGVRYVFPVPEEHRGKKNAILIAEHPNFCLVKDGKDRIVQATDVDAVDRFPTSKEGWFLGNQKYDIPQGDKADGGNQDARYLRRIEKRVGLVALGYCCYGDDDRRNVFLNDRASYGLGVAVEASDAYVACDAPLRMREENGRLIVEGTSEQIAAAARLLEQLKVK